jgi:hypothetical protein
MIYSGDTIEDPELVEICDRVIASSLDNISRELGGPSLVYLVYKGFLDNKHSRSKIV